MRQTKETARKDARTAGKTATKNTNTATRTDRWRRLAEERIARLDGLKFPGLALLRTCAEIEGMAPADLIVERLKATRLGGMVVTERPKEYFSPEFNAYEDTDYELNAPTRTRNNHERSVVSSMVMNYSSPTWIPADLAKKHGVGFVRVFYRRGDNGLYEAFHRMASDALERCAAGRVA